MATTDKKQGVKRCTSCMGTGEVGSDFGPSSCPDCGGVGYLPARDVLVEWRARDIERAFATSTEPAAADVRWLVAELRRARAALVEIVAIAQDMPEADKLAARIRFVANQALDLYEVTEG